PGGSACRRTARSGVVPIDRGTPEQRDREIERVVRGKGTAACRLPFAEVAANQGRERFVAEWRRVRDRGDNPGWPFVRPEVREAHRRGEPVAAFWNRFDIASILRRVAEGLAQSEDVIREVRFLDVDIRPQTSEKLVLG